MTAVAFVPGTRGRWATAGLDGRLRYWDPRGRPVADHAGFGPRAGADPVEGITAFAFSGDGRLVVIGGDATRLAVRTVADGRSWTPRGRASGGPRNDTDHPAAAIAVAGNRLAIGYGTGEVDLWRRTATGFTPDPVTLEPAGGAVGRLAFGPDGDLLVAGGERLGARLWALPARAAATSVPAQALDGDAVRDVAFLGGGHVAALRSGGTVQVRTPTSTSRSGGPSRRPATAPPGTSRSARTARRWPRPRPVAACGSGTSPPAGWRDGR